MVRMFPGDWVGGAYYGQLGAQQIVHTVYAPEDTTGAR